MANNLTGDFDAVVQVAVREINGLLAALHQNGATDDATLKLLHSANLRIGDPPTRPPGTGAFGDWLNELVSARLVPASHLGDVLTSTSPPGAAARLRDILGQLTVVKFPPANIRGLAKVQMSSATISLPAGSTSEVMVHVDVRALYTPDANTDDLPAPIHGEVQAMFDVHVVRQGTKRKLVFTPSAQDSKIQFIAAAGSGLGAADAAKLATEVRKELRGGFILLPVDVPSDFPFSQFKSVGAGASQAVALPLQISSAGTPGLQNIVTSAIGTAGFAFGIGKEFVRHVFQPTIDNLMQFQQNFTVPIRFWWDPTYHFSVTGIDLVFNDKNIDLIVHGKATTGSFGFPNYNNIVIKQRFALLMLFDTMFIQVGDYEPEVSGLPDSAKSSVKAAVVAQRDVALPSAQQSMNDQLANAKARLNNALHLLSPAASATFRAGFSEDASSSTSGGVAITPDGVIIRGDLHTGAAPMAPVIDIKAIEPGKTYSAFTSWIPGGRIDRFQWSWVEGSSIDVVRGSVKSLTEQHRFLLSIPPPAGGPVVLKPVVTQVCLRLEGVRILQDGTEQPVVAGTLCHISEPEVMMDVPSWWEPVHVPVWMPGAREGVKARDAIAGHVTVQTDIPRKGTLTRNSLIYFADSLAPDSLDFVAHAIDRLERKAITLGVTIVLPPGAFDMTRSELERTLASIGERCPVPVQVTEDDEGGWTRTFAVAKRPSMSLINARRQFVWSHEGRADAGVLAAALSRHLVPAPQPKPRPLQLTVSPGDRAPDALFHTGKDEQVALHRTRGRRVLLNFWQSWSEPCLQELRHLQQLLDSSKEPPMIVAFHGGKEDKTLDAIRSSLKLSFALVQDDEQQIARKYGVRCWPTTVSIGVDGNVEHVQYGRTAG